MIIGAMLAGVGGAMLSAGGAWVSGKPLLAVAGCYMAGGSGSMLLALALGAFGRRPGPPARLLPDLHGPVSARPLPHPARP